MTEALHERARRISERELIRGWEYRQRNSSHGVWYRLRRVLVDAAQAWVIDDPDADRLEGLGRPALPVGHQVDPPKRMFFVTPLELKAALSARRIPVQLGREFLAARNLALVSHADAGEGAPRQPETSGE